ncbi:hypothetical protein BDR04DRAFT_211612 [Suillus decipiens]|nr:hypothetical protein BDR04DRAFT_211612 [Suillus decipiens]
MLSHRWEFQIASALHCISCHSSQTKLRSITYQEIYEVNYLIDMPMSFMSCIDHYQGLFSSPRSTMQTFLLVCLWNRYLLELPDFAEPSGLAKLFHADLTQYEERYWSAPSLHCRIRLQSSHAIDCSPWYGKPDHRALPPRLPLLRTFLVNLFLLPKGAGYIVFTTARTSFKSVVFLRLLLLTLNRILLSSSSIARSLDQVHVSLKSPWPQ